MARTTNATTAAETAAATRKTNAVKRSTAAKKGAQTRAAKSAATARRRATAKTSASASRARTSAAKEAAEAKGVVKTRVEQAGDVAGKSVVVPVGAALVARDRVSQALDELRSTYSTRRKTEAELKRFERRGTQALKPLVRDARKTRERVERELRSGRERVEREVQMIAKDWRPVAKNVELVSARVENAVQGGRTAATKASATIQERIAALT